MKSGGRKEGLSDIPQWVKNWDASIDNSGAHSGSFLCPIIHEEKEFLNVNS